jgi:LysR family transcriptional regulator, glycine cleavage system transcriptional activator
MPSRLPPLAFLPAVEAAARLGSFRAAAAALHLTPSAISQQVKAVEDALGRPLFVRTGRSVEPTLEGARYLREVRAALAALEAAGERLYAPEKKPVLRLETVPFVAYEFLMQRLPLLQRQFPGFDLSLESRMAFSDLHGSALDATIRLGSGNWPDLAMHSFGELTTALVCSPERSLSIERIEDLAEQPLIEMRAFAERGLVNLLRALGVRVNPARVLSFETYFETVRAAEAGLGVAIGVFPLTTEWVLAGRLAVPLDVRGPSLAHIALLHRHDDPRFPWDALAEWLREQFAALPVLPAGRLVAQRPRSLAVLREA